MPKDTRDKVTLSPEAYKALEVEAMLHNTSLKDTASKLILKAACPKCIEILGIMDRPAKEVIPPQEPNVIIAQGVDIMPESRTPKSVATVVDVPTTKAKVTKAEEHKGEKVKGTKGPLAQGTKDTKAKKKKLSEDPIALAKLKELYARTPRPSLAAMGGELGYPKNTVNDNIKKMIEKGILTAQ
jgi:hypothetical protein